MSYLLVGAMLLALVYWGGRSGRWLKRPEWRVASGAVSIAAFAAAAFVGIRGGWGKALVLLAIGAAFALSSRWPRAAPPKAAQDGPMSLKDARAVLGVGPTASAEEIQAAYSRLMRVVHPDRGGAVGLAVQLNLARDRLLKDPPA
jgi:hypothetical protein